MATLEELAVKFTADVSELNQGMKKVEVQFQRVENQAKAASAKMSASLGGVSRLLKLDLLVRFGSYLMQVEDRMEQLASAIRDTADRADISTEALQRLRHAADQNGTSAEAMDSALVRLNKAIGLARAGAEGMGEIFAALGLEQLIEKGATTEEVFYGLTAAVSQMGDESQASAIIARIMGREADRLIELMKQGEPDVRALGESLSRVISEETVNKLDEARDKTEEFKKVVNSFASDASAAALVLGRELVEALAGVIGWLDQQLDLVKNLTTAWANLQNVMGAASEVMGGSLTENARADTPSRFVAGGRGVLERESTTISAPSFDQIAAASGAKPNQAAIDKLFAPGGGGGGQNRALTEAARAAEQYAGVIADLTFELEQLARGEQEAAYQAELRSALQSANVTLDSAQGEAIAALVSQMQSLRDAQSALSEAQAAAAEGGASWLEMQRQAGDAVASAFERAIFSGESLRETFAGLLQDLAKMIFQKMVFEQISNAISGAGGLGGIVGGFAAGGSVNPGNAYMVGERGPELFVPKVGGNIVPNRAVPGGGGRGVVINQVLNAEGANPATVALMHQMLSRSKDETLRAVKPYLIDQQRRNRLQGAFS